MGAATLPVDALRAVDSKNVELTLFGEKLIVSRDQLATVTVRRYVEAGRALPLSPKEISALIASGARPELRDVALFTMRSLVDGTEQDEALWRAVQKELDSPGIPVGYYKDISSQEWANGLPRLLVGFLVIEIGMRDPNWPRENISALLTLARDGVVAELVERAANVAIKGNTEGLAALSELSTRLLSSQDEFLSLFRRVLGDLQRAFARPGTQSLEAIQAITLGLPDESPLHPLLVSALNTRAYSHAQEALAQADASAALFALSFIDMDRRTPATHSLVERALREVAPRRSSILGYRPVNLMLRFLSTKDDAVRKAYIRALERQLLFMMAQESATVAEFDFFLRQVLLLRVDPSSENDALRLKFVVHLLNDNRINEAASLLLEVRTGVPLPMRIRLFWAEFSHDLYGLLLAALALIIAGLGLRIRFRSMAEGKSPIDQEPVEPRMTPFSVQAAESSEDGAMGEGGFSLLRQRQMLNPTFLEYERCLKVIGIHSKASLREIKSHYRRRIKDIHPDSVRISSDAGAGEEFMDVTKAYDRALELRKVLGLPDD